ncbi:MAG: hypothetical protein M0027_14540 [Candidatus Dormibacteraeota bacterium]|jgi:hypothetical protein|nr:hypothetical protein [Candidatus Dormibacteraeota bacterium]
MYGCPCCGADVEFGPPWSARGWGPPPWAGARGPWWAEAPTRRERRTTLEERKRRLDEEQLADVSAELNEAP